jgi:hypothetical protein
MATTINSGYANSPKLTANIADHADVYGGRALVFDGVVDAVQTPSIDLGTTHSVSCWVKTSTGSKVVIGIDASNFLIYLNSNLQIQYDATGSPVTSADAIVSGAWNHVVVTRSGTTVNYYINGQVDSGGADTINANDPLSGVFGIGGISNFYFNGSMADVKFFDAQLTEAQVTELYRKPENTPSAVQDNLVAWYPMIEGNPESPQSIVYDHSEKKLGSSEITSASNTTFSGVTSNDWTSSGATKSFSNDQMVFTMDGDSPAVVGQLSAGNFAGGSGIPQKFLKVTLDVDSTTTGSYSINNAGGSCSADVFLKSPLTTGINTIYGVCDGASSYFRIFEVDVSTGDKLVLNSFDVKEVLMGNHATTNFFGDEIVNDPSFDTALANGQTNANFKLSGDGSITGGAFAFTAGGGVGRITIMDDASTETTFANTKTYQVQFTISSSGNALLNFDWANSGYVNYGNGSHTLTAVGDGSNLQIQASASGNDFSMTDISIKEVGISSSGFETAVNEPVVPQVPLMRYNQIAIFDGVNDYVLLPDGLTSGLSELTISLWARKKIGEGVGALFSVHGGGDYAQWFNATRLYWTNTMSGGSGAVNATGVIDNGKMNHYVFTTKSGEGKIYQNGILLASSTSGTGTVSSNYRNLMAYSAGGKYSTGDGNEFAFFNKVLTQAEIIELFNDGIPLDATTHSKASALKAYWRNDGVTTWKNRGDKFASFDGVDDVIIRNAINVDYKSISLWVRPNNTITTTSGTQGVAFFHNWSFGGLILGGNNTTSFDGEIIMMQENESGTNYKTAWVDHSVSIPSDSWSHIALVWDGSKYKIYFNGYSKTLVSADGGHVPLRTNKAIRIGHMGASASARFDGDISHFAIWSESLTDAQVLSIYNAGQNGNIASIQSSDLELYYTFNPHALTDADTNSSVQDRSGNNNDSNSITGAIIDKDGTVSGSPDSITIREGLNSNRDGLGFYFTNPSSNVLRLNGSSEYVSVPHTKSLVVGEQLTLECWAKLDRVTPSEDNTMISKYDEAGDSGREYSLQFPTDKRLIFRVSSAGSSATLKTLRADNAISDGNLWHHYAVTFASGTMKMYVDGSEVSASTSGATVTSIKQDGTANVVVGCVSTSSTPRHFFNGLIDEARVYNRALSGSEINKNYKHQKGKHKND